MIPYGLKNIVEYISSSVLGERRGGPKLPPPSLLSGPKGTGKSWILYEVRKRIALKSEKTGIYPVEIPWSLSPEVLLESIAQGIEDAKLKKTAGGLLSANKEDKFLLFIEEIDSFFGPKTVETHFVRPKKSKGAGAALFSQIKNSSKLRSFLIENHNTISVLATASENLRFLQDSDLPFFQFFNVIDVPPLSQEQTMDQIKSKTGGDWKFKALIDSISKLSPDFAYKLTDGRLLYINAMVDALWDLQTENVDLSASADDVINYFLSLYFYRMDPHMSSTFEHLSGLERQLLDHAILFGGGFGPPNFQQIMISPIIRVLNRLVDKNVLVRESPKSSKFKFKSTTLKAFLRFRRKFDIATVINPDLDVYRKR